MKTIHRDRAQNMWLSGLAVVALVVAIGPLNADAADILGQITRKSGQRVPSDAFGVIRYAGGKYKVQHKGVSLDINPGDVLALNIQKPAGLDRAIQQVNSGQHSAAIPTLQSIMDEYRMLVWDVEAARYLASSYLTTGQAAKAVDTAEVAIKADPKRAYSSDLFSVYCDALLKAKRGDRLDRVLREAVENGTREVAAKAQVMRGNMQFEKGNPRDALVDGYLRTILLFKDVKSAQPEALYRAIKAHEKVGEHSHAEKWRKKLLSEYPDSPYSRELRG